MNSSVVSGSGMGPYVGRVVKVGDGFGFVALSSVTRADGSNHGLQTRRDIFVHQNECSVPLQTGMMLSFDVLPSNKPDQLQAYLAVVVEPQAAEEETIEVQGEVMPSDGSPVPGLEMVTAAPRELAIPERLKVHFLMKEVDKAEIVKAVANRPLKDVPRDDVAITDHSGPSEVPARLSEILFNQFPGLHNLGITFDIDGFDEAAQDAIVKNAVEDCKALGMNAQAESTNEEHRRFKATRTMLQWINEQGWFKTGAQVTPSVVAAMLELVKSLPSSQTKAKTVSDLQNCFGFMTGHNILRPNTVLPMKRLPDLFLAAPVLFHMMSERETRTNGIPEPIQDICGLLKNERWFNLVQLFNREAYPITMFQGDVIPPAILKIMKDARGVFDRVVIMTPYLDIAAREFERTWVRSIDPYVVGFKKGLPVFFILGRFSNTGVFPLLHELVADTMSFLRTNTGRLRKLNVTRQDVRSPAWLGPHGEFEDRDLGTHLTEFAETMLKAYDAERLFDWLNEEWQVPDPARMAYDPILTPTIAATPWQAT